MGAFTHATAWNEKFKNEFWTHFCNFSSSNSPRVINRRCEWTISLKGCYLWGHLTKYFTHWHTKQSTTSETIPYQIHISIFFNLFRSEQRKGGRLRIWFIRQVVTSSHVARLSINIFWEFYLHTNHNTFVKKSNFTTFH